MCHIKAKKMRPQRPRPFVDNSGGCCIQYKAIPLILKAFFHVLLKKSRQIIINETGRLLRRINPAQKLPPVGGRALCNTNKSRGLWAVRDP